MDNPTTPDALPHHWISRMPESLQPYLRLMRLDRPIGVWLLLIPCLWGEALASLAEKHALPNVWNLFLFVCGAIVMRGAGCIWNDYIDRDLDRQVARTRARPLAAGIVSERETLLLMVTLLLAGLVILMQFDGFSIFLGLLSIVPVAVYPYVKRFSDFPQLVLGLAFSWGALLGWSAHGGPLGLAPIMLYASAICWTVGYDTIYAMQDVEDDALIGIGSTPRHFGKNATAFVGICYALAIVFMGSAFKLAQAGFIAYVGILLLILLLGRQVYMLKADDPTSALHAFRENKLAGLTVFAALVLDGIILYAF